ncbi:MAG: HAMP domain-containing histidine kinase [Saprospiraceae bacterium]|nr:HAMP domain-containing histidine kinase [Saprospiraceae bacterium]
MKLIYVTSRYIFLTSLIIVSIWGVLFYYSLLEEIYDSIDDGLANYKMLIIQSCERDTTLLNKVDFEEGNYAIRPIPKEMAMNVTDIYKDTMIYMQYEDEIEPVRMITTAFYQSGRFYELKIISTMVEKDDLISSLFRSVLVLFFLLLLCFSVINYFVLKKTWKPFFRLLNKLRSYKIESEAEPPNIQTTISEFNQLNESIAILIHNARASFENQKRFTENAAHELQTPIAGMIHRLQLILENNSLTDEVALAISQMLKSSEKMAKTNKDLLLLSRIENHQFIEKEAVEFCDIISACIDDLTDFAIFKQVEFIVSKAGCPKVFMNVSLAGILVNNLLKNALVHGRKSQPIYIHIDINGFSVKNTSENGRQLPNQIFERFYKESGNTGSTGLGLAISQVICKQNNLELTYCFKDGHIFSVQKKIKKII